MANFGTTFKKARESKGISLDQIAKQTRISTRFLAAIENEEFQLLPGGIFNKGFVRSFAENVGLDPDQAVADYERLVAAGEPGDVLASASPQPPKSERHLYSIALAILAIAIAVFYIVTRDSTRTIETAAPPSVAAPEPAPQAVPQPPAQITQPPVTPPEPDPEPVAATPAKTTFTIDIEVRETTWIKVTSDGNAVIPGVILQPGATRKFTAENSIYISIGNAAGLAIKINDVPVKPLGKSGQVRSVTITSENLKDFTG
jgi:cytoskeletal protein RodZ